GLDVGALEWALSDVVERHAPLRTVFESVEGEPRQRVLPPEQARVSVERRHVEGDALTGELAAEAGRVFDLAVELPLRAVVFELGDGAVVLSLVVHHIVLGAADDPESVLGRELGFWRGALEGLPEEHGLNL
ncbi:condensation domain-containing protein, partial [Streptomyces globisporus]|uniref:condensation domain-containing protein n=1 Tax=Streptomyces globisporus TaxID=1908 RepID=UPI0005686E4E